MEEYKEELDKIKERWKEDYFLGLGIYQHLEECKQKFDMVKNHAILTMKKEDLQTELDKELADLKVLLDMYVKEGIYKKRINKFLENAK